MPEGDQALERLCLDGLVLQGQLQDVQAFDVDAGRTGGMCTGLAAYVIMQPETRLDRPVKAYARRLGRIPWVYSVAVLDEGCPRGGTTGIA
ncbi:hypothetical protein [Streptomyces sp. NRRL WC-3549]|uniref:hypothetical protein n=1 Tax=Streptomyces sp. NRRL WC-3549 TaxID=1463925 RepID=UPI0004C65F35|nr:hypothetical protein [Streptomyces sp. NRRL WC-3549]